MKNNNNTNKSKLKKINLKNKYLQFLTIIKLKKNKRKNKFILRNPITINARKWNKKIIKNLNNKK
jgi:hypothetical protein